MPSKKIHSILINSQLKQNLLKTSFLKSVNIAVTLGFTLLCLTSRAQGISEQDYLKINKDYTDLLIQYLQTEENLKAELADLKAKQAQANSTLNRSKSALNSTSENLTRAESELISLNNKLTNRAQIETRLNAEKQQNLTSISRLEGQISSVSQGLQSLNFEISNLMSQRSQIQTRLNTQEQLFRNAENNVRSLERENNNFQNQINQNDRQVTRLRNEIQNLRQQSQATTDPAEQQRLQQQIANLRTRVQSLESDSRLNQGSIQSNEIRLISERSQMNQIESNIRSLNIELNGNRSLLNSLDSQKRQIESQVATLRSQINTLKANNRSIDAEIASLSQLPQEITRTEANIRSLTLQKNQQTTLVATHQTALDVAQDATAKLQLQVDTAKEDLLSAESNHAVSLAEFKLQNPSPATFVEASAGVDSLINVDPIATSRDWSIYRAESATLAGQKICSASTRILDANLGTLSELHVLKVINQDGSYSSPFVMMTQSSNANPVFSGVLKTDRSQDYDLALLQSPVSGEVALMSPYTDITAVINALRAHNRATISFYVPGSAEPVVFSLRGSSNAINEMLNKCK